MRAFQPERAELHRRRLPARSGRARLGPLVSRAAPSVVATLLAVGCGAGSTTQSRGDLPTPRGSAKACVGTTLAASADLDPTDDLVLQRLVSVGRSRTSTGTPRGSGHSCDELPIDVRYPKTAPRALPLVVVAHGLDGDPQSLRLLLDAWARAGYVVAAPKFPVTQKDDAGESLRSESVEQAHDLSRVITQMLRESRRRGSPLFGRIDSRHIGAAGMSLGGLAVYGLISNSCCLDRRVGAATLMAAVRRQFPDERYQRNRVPVLLIQGDADPGYHNSLDAYPELRAPKWFITLRGSKHAPPFEVPPGREAPFVYATTTDFWDAYLKGDANAPARIQRKARATAGRATVRRALRN